jgi:hypothetical protein
MKSSRRLTSKTPGSLSKLRGEPVGTYLDGESLNNKPRGRTWAIVKERRVFRSAALTLITAEWRRALGVAGVITANTRGAVVLHKERMTPAEATRTRVVMEVDDSHD